MPRLVFNVSEPSSRIRVFGAAEVAAMMRAEEEKRRARDAADAAPGSRATRWRGVEPTGSTEVEIKVGGKVLRRSLRLPPPRVLAAECDVCAVELRPGVDLEMA